MPTCRLLKVRHSGVSHAFTNSLCRAIKVADDKRCLHVTPLELGESVTLNVSEYRGGRITSG